MAKFKFTLWLAYWFEKTNIFDFNWDNGNLEKSTKKHLINSFEAESVFSLKKAICLGEQISPATHEPRFALIGISNKGNILFINFTFRYQFVRIISARPANKKERLLLESKTIKNL